jgi:hypothetical protein
MASSDPQYRRCAACVVHCLEQFRVDMSTCEQNFAKDVGIKNYQISSFRISSNAFS